MPAFLLAAGDGAHLPLTLLIVFGAAKILAEAFERLGQPGIVGEILAGVLIGPSVLAWIRPDQLLSVLAELGVMFLLFRVGLEVKSSEIFRVGGVAMTVAVLGVVLPFLAGWGIILAFGYPGVEAIFVGSALVATSVGITAQVLASQGLLEARASRIILAAAVIDDVLGLLVLAAASSLAKGSLDMARLMLTAGSAIAFTGVVAWLGTRAVARMAPRVEQRLKTSEAQFTIALLLLFGLSAAAVYIGVAAIIGAFLAGMALGETVNDRVRDLASGITELLVPFFLAGIGLHLDVRAFRDPSILGLALLITLAAIATKLIGCGAGAWTLGRADMLRVGIGMAPRGEVGMVVAQIGLTLGVVTANIYAVVVFMAVATTLIAPPLLRIAYKGVPASVPREEFQIG